MSGRAGLKAARGVGPALASCALLAACGSSGASKTSRTAKRTATVAPATTTAAPAPSAPVTTGTVPFTSRVVTIARACRATSTPGAQTKQSAHYAFLMHVGPYQVMVMGHQPATKNEEVMLGGTMNTLSDQGSGPSIMRHLEVHICSLATGQVVTGANPTILLTQAGAAPRSMPIMEMEGPNDPGDYHYGNNVPLHPGAAYSVVVELGGDRVKFSYREPTKT